MEQRILYSSELIRHGWVDPDSILTDGVIDALYADLLTELMAGSSPEFGESPTQDDDSESSIMLDGGVVGEVSRTTLTPVVMTTPPASPSLHPSPQARVRRPVDISELAAAASAAARATARFAPDASSALSAFAVAASAIAAADSRELSTPQIPFAHPVPRASGIAASNAAASGDTVGHATASGSTSRQPSRSPADPVPTSTIG